MDWEVLPAVPPEMSFWLSLEKKDFKCGGKKENRFKKNNFWLWVTKGFYFQFIANGFWELKSKITPGFEQNHPKRNQQTTGEAWLSKCTFFLLKSGLGEKASFYNH